MTRMDFLKQLEYLLQDIDEKDREDQLGGHHGGGDRQMQKNEGVHSVYLLERGSVRRIDYRCGCPWNYQ